MKGIDMSSDCNKKSNSSLSIINFLLILVLGYFVANNYLKQESRIYNLYKTIENRYTVDFTTSNVQPIDDKFLLVRAKQDKHLTGVNFLGRIINTQSVTYEDLIFKITVNSVSREFHIKKISPGHSTGFKVYVPDLDIKDARYAEIEYVRYKVSYYP
jgi:hypothetical protein